MKGDSDMAKTLNLESVIQESVADMIQRISGAIASSVSSLIQDEFNQQVRNRRPAPRVVPAISPPVTPTPAARVAAPRGKPATGAKKVTHWVADKFARRVPNFVLESTGLPDKKSIVAKYGDGATFELGKPAPKPSR
jgi:hypothetical protein